MTNGRPMTDYFLFKDNPPSTSLSREAMYNQIRNELRGQATNLAMMLADMSKQLSCSSPLLASSLRVVSPLQGAYGHAKV